MLQINNLQLRKPEHIAFAIILINLLILIGTDIHLPALPHLQADLKTTEFKAQMVLVVFFVGAIISRLVWGPASDMYGRKKILLTTIGLQVISQLGAINAINIEWLIFWRGVQSLGAGVISVVGTAILSDLFRGDRRAKYLGIYEISYPVAYVLAPILGAFIFEAYQDWRAIFKFVFITQLIAWFCFMFFLPETLKHKSHTEFKKTFKQYILILKDWNFLKLNMLSSIMSGSYMMFLVTSPFIYMVDFKISAVDFAYYQFAPMILNILALLIYKQIVEKYGADQCLKMGIKALYILPPLYFAIGLDFLPCTALTLLIAVCLQSFIMPFFIPAILSKSLELYSDNRGMAASASGSLRGLFMSVMMVFGIYYIGSNAHNIVIAKGIFALSTIIIASRLRI